MLMINSTLAIWIAASLYSLASVAALYQLKPHTQNAQQASTLAELATSWTLPIGVLALCAHGIYAYSLAFTLHESNLTLNLSVASMSALISAILVATFLLLCRFMTLSRLAAIVFPLTIVSLIFSHLWSMDNSQSLAIAGNTSTSLKLHILTSILAYTFITMSAIQALVYRFQESQLKKRVKASILTALPPLETMESLVFRLLLIGFVLLTITLVSGSFFSQVLFGYPFEFKHHTVFASLGWLISAGVLFARARAGMRGGQATLWILAAFLCLQLGYFGSKIILELIH